MSVSAGNTSERAWQGGIAPRRALLLLTAAVPFLIGADDSLDDRRLRVEGMTAVERAALQHNFALFRAMSMADKERYRALHAKVEEDHELGRVLQKYSKWLETLSAVQREELRKAPDATARFQLVRTFREEQAARKSIRSPAAGTGPWAGGPNRPIAPGARFPSVDVGPMMNVLESRARLPESKRQDWDRISTAQRHSRIMAGIARQLDESPALRGHWPDEALLNDLVQAVPDEGVRSFLRKSQNTDQQRMALLALIVKGLHGEWREELEKHRPQPAVLQKFFTDADDRQRADMMRFEQGERDRALLFEWASRQENPLGEDLREFRQLTQRFTPRDRSRGPGERPPGEGSPPDRSPGANEPSDGGRRPPPDRRSEGDRFRDGERLPPDDRRRPNPPRQGERRPEGERRPDGERRPEGEFRPPPEKRPPPPPRDDKPRDRDGSE